MTKAVGLLSGGLDSSLATKLMLDQGIEVRGLNFSTPFSIGTRKEREEMIRRIGEELGIKVKVIQLGKDYIEMVKNPKYGYGKHLNPCIDCRIFMLKKAKEELEKVGAAFVFTGDVLGQRPMSQRKELLKIIEKEASLDTLILRPLSARLLEPTLPEKTGLVNREKLLAIKGRSRKEQLKLAKKHKLTSYTTPAGGCRLAEKEFATKLKDAFEHGEDSLADLALLRYGRHFRLPSKTKVVVGRNELENKTLSELAKKGDLLLEVKGFGSPIALLKKSKGKKDIKFAAALCARYSDGKDSVEVEVKVWSKRAGRESIIIIKPMNAQEVKTFRV